MGWVVYGCVGEGDSDDVIGVFRFGVLDCCRIDVAVTMARDFEQPVGAWNHEEAVGEIENCWSFGEGCFLLCRNG